MNVKTSFRALPFLLCATFLSALQLSADVVETRNGARIVGKVTKIEDGKVFVTTDYAGDLTIKQGEVIALNTEAPVFVRLASGTVLQGTLAGEGSTLKIAGADGELTTKVEKLAASWGAGGEDPQVTAMKKEIASRERKWAYQSSIDLTGKSGNTNSTGLAAGFTATLANPQDALKFYANTNYATSEDAAGVQNKTADEVKGGVDYASFFSEHLGWFVRQELERDNVEDVNLRSTTDAGFTYRVIKTEQHQLTARLGAGYRFESYGTGVENKGAVISTGLNNAIKFGEKVSLVTELQFLPSVNDFADYRFVHDSALEFPINAGFWKLRVGLNNQYNSRPQPGREEMDTTYYTRLVLSWK
jgi:putative salt-induced outer membrane protein YdiY